MPGFHRVESYRVGVSGRRRIGIFGGTFDPPHIAHVVLAAAAIDQLDLDELLVTVAGVPWQKVDERSVSPGHTRFEMTEVAFAPVAGAVVSDMELRREGNSYTIDTLESLAGPDTDLFLLLGSDAAAGLDTWERHEDLADVATIAVFPRRGSEELRPPDGFEWTALELPGLEISSTDIRNRTRAGTPIVGLTPGAVLAIIEREGLYMDSPTSGD